MITRPVFIIGCPRSGTSLLYNILSEVPEFWSIGYESKAIIEKHHSPEVKNWQSGELTASDLTLESKEYILNEFKRQAAPGTFWRTINHFRGWLRSNLFYQVVFSLVYSLVVFVVYLRNSSKLIDHQSIFLIQIFPKQQHQFSNFFIKLFFFGLFV